MTAHVLGKLLAAWTNERSEELRAAVLALDAAAKRAPFEGTTAEWVKRAATAGVEERGALFLALKGPKVADTQQRLAHARAFPADPRLNAAIEALLGEVPYSADSSKPVWRAAFELVSASRDARFAQLARELPQRWKVRALMRSWLESAFARAVAELPREAPPASAATLKLLEELGPIAPPAAKAGGSGKTEAALLAAIYAAPFDDGPRRAYADALLEKGDERGEFIALQLEGRDPKRQAALLKKHGKKWLGAIGPVLGKSYGFRRGFLAVATVKFRHQADAEKYGSLPEWGTVEELTWSHPNPIPRGQEPWCCFVGPTMRALKIADGAWVPHLIAAKQPWALESLIVHGGPADQLKALTAATSLPKLERVSLQHVDAAWLNGLDWPKHIRTLALPRFTRAPGVLAKASALKLERLEIGPEHIFTRGSDAALSKLHVKHSGSNPLMAIEMAARLPDGALESVDFDRTNAPQGFEQAEAAYLAKVRKAGQAPVLPAAGTMKSGPQPLGQLESSSAMVVLDDGTLIVLAGNRLVWADAAKQLQLKEEPVSGIRAAALTPDGRLLTVAHKAVELRDVASGAVVQSGAIGIIGYGADLTLSFGAGRVSLGSRVFDLAKNEECKAPRGAGNVMLLAPDLSCWVKHGAPYTLHRPGVREGVPLEHATTLGQARFSGGELIGRTNERVCAWELATGRLLRSRVLHGDLKWLVRSRDDRRLLVQAEKGSFDVLDAATFETIAKLPWPGPAWPAAGAFSRDGKTFYAVRLGTLQSLPIAG